MNKGFSTYYIYRRMQNNGGMAQAGGKNPEGIDSALAKVAEVVREQVR